MNTQKRAFLVRLSAITFGAAAELVAAGTWARTLVAQNKFPVRPTPSDPSSTDQQFPNLDPRIDPKQVLKQNNTQIHDNVEKLYYLAKELKAEVDENVSENVLSIGMVQKCDQIEKFAKQIRSLAKG